MARHPKCETPRFCAALSFIGLPGRSSERWVIARLHPLAALGNYAAAVFVLRCAPDEDWWAMADLNC